MVEHEEIQKYDPDYTADTYHKMNIVVVGKEKVVDDECDPYSQCRQGPYTVIYDIQSITILE